jgi:glutamate synthase (NADPH/NADH) large chain
MTERNPVAPSLDETILKDAGDMILRGEKIQLSYTIRNTHRSIGARLSSLIVRQFRKGELQEDHITLRLRGSAGQSLGAFAARGLRIEVLGDANDYVGKGLSGATIIIAPPPSSRLATQNNTIIGNTVLYGATSGKLFAAGQAGERFAVRNSGAQVVVEGCGSNGCEYMTGGTAVILGQVGQNFAAGMTGGMAFVWDEHDTFRHCVNEESVVWQRLASAYWEGVLRALVEEHARETRSLHAQNLVNQWEYSRNAFWHICPKELVERLEHPLTEEKKRQKMKSA